MGSCLVTEQGWEMQNCAVNTTCTASARLLQLCSLCGGCWIGKEMCLVWTGLPEESPKRYWLATLPASWNGTCCLAQPSSKLFRSGGAPPVCSVRPWAAPETVHWFWTEFRISCIHRHNVVTGNPIFSDNSVKLIRPFILLRKKSRIFRTLAWCENDLLQISCMNSL